MIRSFARLSMVTAAVLAVCLVSVVEPVPARAEQARKAYDFVDSIGVAAHISRKGGVLDDNGWSKITAAIVEAGIRNMRTTITNNTGINRAQDLYVNHGVRFNFTIDSRSLDGGNKKTTPLNPDRIDDFIDMIKQIDPDAIRSFEGPNEYSVQESVGNDIWHFQLRDYQSELYTTIKTASGYADKLVIAPSIWRRKQESYELLASILGSSYKGWDRGCLHKYHAGYMPTEKMDESIQDAKILSPDAPLFVTEYGYTSFTPEVNDPDVWYPITEYSQAKYLGRYLGEFFIRPDVERSFLYQIIDEKPLAQVPDEAKGLLRNDFSKRPAYFAYKNTIALLDEDQWPDSKNPDNLNFNLIGDLTDVHYFLVQKYNGVFFLVIWQEVKSYDRDTRTDEFPADRPLTLSFNSAISQVRTYLPTGLDIPNPENGRLPIETLANPTSVALKVPDELLVVEIVPSDAPDEMIVASAGANPVFGNAPVTVDFAGSATPAGSYSYSWDFGDGTGSTLRNPSHTYSSPGTYTAVLTVIDGAETAENAVTIHANVATDTKKPTVPQNFAAELVSSNQIDFSWTPSTDNVGVSHYNIYKDGQRIATSTGPGYSFSAKKGKWYSFEVSAEDAAGNESADSDKLKVYIYKSRLVTR
jgi:PKD repeat protein